MKYFLLAIIVGTVTLFGCTQDDTTQPPATGGLTATPNSVSLHPGSSQRVAISGGSRPYSILSPPSASTATAALDLTGVTIHGVGGGSTSLKIGDNGSPQKNVQINISVATSAASIVVDEE